MKVINGVLLNKPGARKCLYCGELLPKKHKRYCDIICQQQHKKESTQAYKRCTRCHNSYPNTLENFYWRHDQNKLGTMCKQCRRDSVRESRERIKAGAKHKKALAGPAATNNQKRRLDGVDRSTRDGFQKYMASNPQYFRDIFKIEPTSDNISAAYRSIQGAN